MQGQYAPGSTFKLITAYAAMASGLITANTHYNDRGTYVRRRADVREHRTPRAASTCPKRSPCRATSTSTGSATTSIGNATQLGNAMQDTARPSGSASETGMPIAG